MISPPLGARLAPGFWLATIASGFLACAGCGLPDYEARMDLQQKKLLYADEQNLNLEGYKLRLPDRKPDDELTKDEFFMRPPKGISADGDDKIIGNDIAHFAATGTNPIQDVWVAAVKRDSEKKFQKDVLDLLNIKTRQSKPKTVGGPAMPQLTFDWIHDEQGSKGTFDAYFYKRSPFLAAIVFRTEGTKNAVSTPPQIDFALASLRLGSEAKGQRTGKTVTPFKVFKK